jgi:hypothetical protein
MTTVERPMTASRPPTGEIDTGAPLTGERMVEQVARCAVEIVRDMRPVTALSRVVTPEVSAYLARRAALTRRLRASSSRAPRVPMSISGLRVCPLGDHAVEASAVVRETDRARFLAMRWERRHTGWRVTVLEIG